MALLFQSQLLVRQGTTDERSAFAKCVVIFCAHLERDMTKCVVIFCAHLERENTSSKLYF